MGAQKNRLIETVLLSTHNICFGLEIKKIIFQYTHLSGALQRVEDHTYCVSDDPAPDTCTLLDNVNGTCCNTTGCQYVTCNKTDAPANVTSGLS